MSRSRKSRRSPRGPRLGRVRQREALEWAPKSLPALLERAVPPMSSSAPLENQRGMKAIAQVIARAEMFWLGEQVMPVVASFAEDLSRVDVLGTVSRGATALVSEVPLPPLPVLPGGFADGSLLSGLSPSGVVFAPGARGGAYVLPLVAATELMMVDPSFSASDEELGMVFGPNPVLPGETDLVTMGLLPVDGLPVDHPLFELARWFTAARLLCDIPGAVTAKEMRVLRAPGTSARARGRLNVTHGEIETVRVVNLASAAPRPKREGAGEVSRTYEYRWPVKGHERLQACGPGLSERRLTWIAPHMKGPEGAPLLRKVTSWTDPSVVTSGREPALVGGRP